MEVTAVFPSQLSRPKFVLLACVAVVLALTFGASAAQATSACAAAPGLIDPSCFEGGDGNLTVDTFGQLDWESLTGVTQYQDPTPAGPDDIFDASGAKEEKPGEWKLKTGTPQGKDVLNAAYYTDQITPGGDIFLYAAFQSDTQGTTNVSIELNKTWSGSGLPTRSENDILITFDHSGQNPAARVGLCFWHGDASLGEWRTAASIGGVAQGSAIGGNTDCPDISGDAQGAVNAGGQLTGVDAILDKFDSTIAAGDFGEMEIDLTTALNVPGIQCFAFGGVWIHSRSSSQANSTMEDYVQPSNLVGAANCSAKLKVKKTTAPTSSGSDQFDFTTTDQTNYKLDTNAVSATPSEKSFTYTADGTEVVHEGTLPTGWTLDGITCQDAANADATNLEFSSDGVSYHTPFAAGDSYARFDLAVGVGNTGDDITCTFNNTKAATLVVKKTTDPTSSAPDDFDFSTTGQANYSLDTDPASGTSDTSSTFSYTDFATKKIVREIGPLPSGWSLDGISCTNASNAGADATNLEFSSDGASWHTPFAAGDDRARFNVAAGDAVSCTFNNTKAATLVVTKTTDPANSGADQFDFATTGQTDYKLDTNGIAGDGADSDHSATFSYTDFATKKVVQEKTLPAGWTLDGISCTNASNAGADATNLEFSSDGATWHTPFAVGDTYARFNVAAGDDIGCTFNNTKEATVKITKVTSPANADVAFGFTTDSTAIDPTKAFDLNAKTSPTLTVGVPAGTYKVTENDPGSKGYDLTDLVCNDPSLDSTVSKASREATIVAAAGETVECTFTNTKRPPAPPGGGPAPTPNPKVGIDKVGPAQAIAGSAIQYGIAVTNTGDVSFPEQNVALTDAQCDAPPVLVGKLGDTTPATLDPGEVWGYSCTVTTALGQASVHNIACVDAATLAGTHVTACDTADTVLVQPQQGVQPETIRPASARLQGPKSCLATRKTATAIVTGKRIASVTFLIDGKAVKTIKASKSQTSRKFKLTLDARRFNFDKHTVTARVTFLAGSNLKTKTLKLTFARCVVKAVKPQFTG